MERQASTRADDSVPGLVSTIIPVFNRPGLLKEAVSSVLAQTYRPIEIIIVDDGSTDGTPELIASLIRARPDVVRQVRVTNGGPGAAREAGRGLAKGGFIQYLDSDDLLYPSKFAVQVEQLRNDDGAAIAYGKTCHVGVGDPLPDDPKPFKRTGERFEHLFPSLLLSRWWSTSTPLYRRSLTDRIGPWRPLWNEEDWEYEARAARLGARLVYCDTFVSVTRWHDERLHHGGTTSPAKLSDRAQAHISIYKSAREYGITPAAPEMQHFARDLFMLARQCGAAGLRIEARDLFEISREAAGPERGQGLDYRIYRTVAAVAGWRFAGRSSRFVEMFRSG